MSRPVGLADENFGINEFLEIPLCKVYQPLLICFFVQNKLDFNHVFSTMVTFFITHFI